MNKYLFICCTIFCLAGCQNHTIYHLYQPVNKTGWGKNDTIRYTLPSLEASVPLNIEIGIRHKDSYMYRDIWLCILQNEQADTIHLYLANKNGNWKGHGIGEMRLFTEEILFRIHQQDSIHSLQITHIMEDDTLRGVHDIGLCIKATP